MNWQDIIDQQLIGSGKVSQAAIISPDGVYTSSSDFQLTSQEQHAIERGFANPDAVQANGLRINGEKYFTLQAAPELIYVKKRSDGAILVKTGQVLLVAMYQSPLQQQETNIVVSNVGDLIRSQGY